MGNKYVRTFLVGAGVGLAGHAIIALTALAVPADLVTPAAMLIFGVLSAVVIASGMYLKIAAFGGDGAAIPLCGLMFGAAMARAEAQKKGASAGAAILRGFVSVIIVVGVGFAVSAVFGFISKNPGASSVGPVPVPVQFIGAMVIGGLTCIITQVLVDLRIPFPVAAILMVGGLGGFLSMTGTVQFLQAYGAGGVNSTAVGCGNGAYTGAAVLAATGVPVPFIIAILINVILVLMGALAGGPMMEKLGPKPE